MIKAILIEIAKLTTTNIKNNIPTGSGISRILNHFHKLKLVNKDFNSVYIHTIVAFSEDVTNPDLIKYFCNEDIIELFKKRAFETDKDEFIRITDSVLHRCGLLGLKEYQNLKQLQPEINIFIEYFEALVNQCGNPLLLKMYNTQKESDARQQEEIYRNSFEFQSEKYMEYLIKDFDDKYLKKNYYIEQKGKIKEWNISEIKPIDIDELSPCQEFREYSYFERQTGFIELPKHFKEQEVMKILDPIDDYINKWINNNSQNFLAIMGEYGTGKTTLCRHLAHQISTYYFDDSEKTTIKDKNKRKVFLINLRNFKAEEVEKYLIAEMNENGIKDFDKPDLYNRIDNNELIFIFDGFDEMTQKIDTDEKKSNFFQIEKLIRERKNSKVILTSREEYFTSDNELNEVFRNKDNENYKIIHLNLFDDEQIKAYLETHTTNSQFYLNKIKEIYDLSDLAPRPVLLDFIVKYLPKLIDEKGENFEINASDLYEFIINDELSRKKIELPSLDNKLPGRKRLQLLQQLSVWMYQNDTLIIDTRLIKEKLNLEEFFKVKEDYEIIKYLNIFLNFTFLIKESDYIFRISHKSFRDYLVATEFVKEINSGKINVFGKYQISYEIVHFISEQDPNTKKLESMAYSNDEATEDTKWQKSNAFNILMKLRNPYYYNIINFYKNEKEIDLYRANISDITPLKDLVNVETLDLEDNQITDIEVLKELRNLKKLFLSGNQIKKINPLEGLSNIASLYLDLNQISDINPLRKLKNLSILYLSENRINDIEPLKELKNLTKLYIKKNIINDIEPFNELNNLNKLDLSKNRINDIKHLKELKNLTELNLGNNQISDIKYLKELNNLNELDLSENRINDIEPFKKLNNLTKLYLK